MIFIPWHFPLHEDPNIQGASDVAEVAFKKQYSAVYDYLLSHRQALENRNKAETGIRYEWYALQRFGSNYWREFEKKKIVWGNLSLRGAYSFAEPGVYVNAPSSFIPSGNSYLLAILNSKIADFYIKQLGVTRNGGYFEYKPMFLERLPVPHIDAVQEAKFEQLVNQKMNAEPEQQSIIDLEIDDLACNLYGLSKDEKDYVYDSICEN